MSEQSTNPETQIAELTTRLAESQQALASAREALDASERKRQIDRELTAQGALDLETAALLTEAAIAGLSKADVSKAITDLKRTKPFLFRTSPPRPASAMSSHAGPADHLASSADHARTTGDRRALLSYLRLRQSA